MWIVDAYVETGNFPESDNVNGISYQRNAVKAVVNARTCAVTLYAVDPTEPSPPPGTPSTRGCFTPSARCRPSWCSTCATREPLQQPGPGLLPGPGRRPAARLQPPGGLRLLLQEQLLQPLPGAAAGRHRGPDHAPVPGADPARQPDPAVRPDADVQPLQQRERRTGEQHDRVAGGGVRLHGDRPSTPGGRVPLGNNTNVRGPYQFDNNSNTDPTISQQRTLLGQVRLPGDPGQRHRPPPSTTTPSSPSGPSTCSPTSPAGSASRSSATSSSARRTASPWGRVCPAPSRPSTAPRPCPQG